METPPCLVTKPEKTGKPYAVVLVNNALFLSTDVQRKTKF
jgi:hypothetical protein